MMVDSCFITSGGSGGCDNGAISIASNSPSEKQSNKKNCHPYFTQANFLVFLLGGMMSPPVPHV